VECVDDAILWTEAEIVETERAVASHVGGFAAREVYALAGGRGRAGCFEPQLRMTAEKVFDGILAEILRSRKERTEIFRAAYTSRVDARLLESSSIER